MQKILVLILAIMLIGPLSIGYSATQTFDDGTTLTTTTFDDGSQLYQSTDTMGGSNTSSSPSTDTTSTSASNSSSANTIFTSEMVPGAKCQCVTGAGTSESLGTADVACKGAVTARKYKCTVPTGLAGFQSVFVQIIRFVINIVLLLGVLSVVGLGIAWSFAGGDDIKAKSTLKMWAINILIGLAILFFFRYILLFLAPWVYE